VEASPGDPDSPESLAAFNAQYEGYCADLAKKIAGQIDFRYRIVPVKDKKYGAFEEKTGKWNGMVGELIEHVRFVFYNHVNRFVFSDLVYPLTAYNGRFLQ